MIETRAPSALVRWFRGLPLFTKLLIPFLLLVLVLGLAGAFLLTRDLSTRAQAALDRELSRRSLEAGAGLRGREFYLLEAASFAANLSGMADAIRSGDGTEIVRILRSVRALKTDLDHLAITDERGRVLVEYARDGAEASLARRRGRGRVADAFVTAVLAGRSGERASALARIGGAVRLGIAAPVCAEPTTCEPVGAAIASINGDALAETVMRDPIPGGGSHVGVAIFDQRGRRLAARGTSIGESPPPAGAETGPVRRTEVVASERVAVLYAPIEVAGRRVGTLAVGQSADPAFSAVRRTAVRLSLVLLAAMAAVVALGAALSRSILAQVRPLIDTNRALGRGDLSARAPVLGDDELGELATGVNQMAEQLQASVETLESTVTQRTEEIRRLLETRTEFFASLSHEFRTPLAVILGQADRVQVPEQAGETIKDAARQLLGVVNDILELAQAETGGIEIEIEDVRLRDILDDLQGTIDGLAHGAGLTAIVNVPKGLTPVRADPVRLREIMLNLIDNAVKYTPDGGVVRVEASVTDDAVSISVSDTGVGIPPEAAERIFEPFFRVPSTRPPRGGYSTGLGLALTKRLVDAQHGTIAFSSEPGVGTTFVVTLPASGRERGARDKGTAPRRRRGTVKTG